MKITGYKLREAIKQQELRRDTAASMFDDSLKVFPDETKTAPQDVVKAFLDAETAVARLQTAQMRFNLAVSVDVLGEKMTLAEAIKRVGGQGRAEKMWRSAAGGKRRERYGYDDDELDPTKVRAKPTITPDTAVKLASSAGRVAGAFRAAIATANAQEIEIENLLPELFE